MRQLVGVLGLLATLVPRASYVECRLAWAAVVGRAAAVGATLESREDVMGTYGLQEVIRRWERGKLTTEQAIGQILLLILELEWQVQELERQFQSSRGTFPPGRLCV